MIVFQIEVVHKQPIKVSYDDVESEGATIEGNNLLVDLFDSKLRGSSTQLGHIFNLDSSLPYDLFSVLNQKKIPYSVIEGETELLSFRNPPPKHLETT